MTREVQRLFWSATIVLTLVSGCTADLRPDSLEDGISSERSARGRALLDELSEAHGGIGEWRAHRTASFTVRDHWPNWLTRTAAMPWDESGQLLRVETLLGTDEARLTFMEGSNEGTQWGLQNWATYKVDREERLVFEPDDSVKFWVPTVVYFFEAPFRLREANVVAWIGEERVDGVLYDRVFASWNTAEPQDEIDQYVAWIERETGRLGFLQYTVRDMMSNITGLMRYTDYEKIGGIWLARTMAVVDSTDTMKGMHRMELEEVRFGEGPEVGYFYPKPDIEAEKHP